MKHALRALVVALIALLAATPASAAKKPANSFRIRFDVSFGIIDTGYYMGSFRASGAIEDSGPTTATEWPWGEPWYPGYVWVVRLTGEYGDLYIGIPLNGDGLSGTFTIDGGVGGAYSDTSGSGTATGKLRSWSGKWEGTETVYWELEGTLSTG